jgi:hypothetical protein
MRAAQEKQKTELAAARQKEKAELAAARQKEKAELADARQRQKAERVKSKTANCQHRDNEASESDVNQARGDENSAVRADNATPTQCGEHKDVESANMPKPAAAPTSPQHLDANKENVPGPKPPRHVSSKKPFASKDDNSQDSDGMSIGCTCG